MGGLKVFGEGGGKEGSKVDLQSVGALGSDLSSLAAGAVSLCVLAHIAPVICQIGL